MGPFFVIFLYLSMQEQQYRRESLRIRAIPRDLKQQIDNIADHMEKSTSAYVKDLLVREVQNTPEHLKTPVNRKDD